MEARELFEILVRETVDSVRAFLLSSMPDRSAVDDLVQETYLVAWRNLDRYDRDLPFGPWVRGIAAKLMLNHRRKYARSKVHFCDATTLQMLDRRFEEFDDLAGDTFDEKMDALRDCIGQLSPGHRSTVDLHYQHGLGCKAIAERLGKGLEAVKKQLQRARSALQRCLQGRLEEVRP